MGPRLILHIGASKTGSSAIQDFLRLNCKALRDLGFLVPDRELGLTGHVTGEHVMAFQEYFNHSNKTGIEAAMQALAQAGAGAVVMSAENLSNANNFQFFANALRGMPCKVIIYVRRQDEFLTSSWQQWYSKVETDLNAWLILALQRFGQWLRCIDGWESVAGAGNVTVRVFQKSDLINGDVVDDFVGQLGLAGPLPDFARSTTLVNPSYSDIITPIVSGSKTIFTDAHDNGFYQLVGKLTGDRYVKQKKVSLITPQQRDKIVEFYRPQNEAICRKYFPGRPRLFEAVDHSKYDYLNPVEMTRRQLEFLASMIYATHSRDR